MTGATHARIDPSLRNWLPDCQIEAKSGSQSGQDSGITGKRYEGETIQLTELNVSGLTRAQVTNHARLLSIAIADFGQCRGSVARRPFSLVAKRFAFVALPDESISFQIDSPRVSGLILQLPLDTLLAECQQHEIDNPDPLALQDSIPGHESLLLACARQLLDLADQPETPARKRLQAPLESSILSLLASLVPSRGPKPLTSANLQPQSIHVEKAIRYLEQHLADPINLTMICQACNVSARTLQTAFQSVTSRTPLQMLQEMRLTQLRELLLQGIDVRTACSQTGLQPTGRLSASYKRLFGELPRQTRVRSKA